MATIPLFPVYMHMCNRTLSASKGGVCFSSPTLGLAYDLPCSKQNVVEGMWYNFEPRPQEVLQRLPLLSWNTALRQPVRKWSLHWGEKPQGRGWIKVPRLTVAPIARHVREAILDHPVECSHMSDPRWDQLKDMPNHFTKLWQIGNHCCFKPLSFGVATRYDLKPEEINYVLPSVIYSLSLLGSNLRA